MQIKVKAHTRNGKRIRAHVRNVSATRHISNIHGEFLKRKNEGILQSNSGPLENNPSTKGRLRSGSLDHEKQFHYHKSKEKKMLNKIPKVIRQTTRDKYAKSAIMHGKKAQQHFKYIY